MELPGTELENDPDGNPCFGCGPRNPSGLRLRFFFDGTVVRSQLEPRPEYAGWPEMWNLGLVIAGAVETCGWAAWEFMGPNRPTGKTSLEFLGPIRLSVPLLFEARKSPEGDPSSVECRVLQKGECVTRLSIPLIPLSPEEARTVMSAVKDFPAALRAGFEARAREG